MRLFVAVWPPPEIVERIAALDRPEVRGLRWTTVDQWHVTLRFLGEVPDLDEAVAALSQGCWTIGGPVVARMGPATDRFGARILHVPVAGLDEVAAAVTTMTGGVGEPPEDRPFRGHITLGRVRRGARIDLRPLCRWPLAGEWDVRAVDLVASHLHPGGARYETVFSRPAGAGG